MYYCSEESGQGFHHQDIDATCIYADRVEAQEFIKKAKDYSLITAPPPKGDIKLQKAIAVLAAEKAESSAKFRSGAKVNASAIKTHIISLTKKYGISPKYLASFDDELNKILDHYDLKEPAKAGISATPKKPRH